MNSSEGLVYSDERDLAVLKIKPIFISVNTLTPHLVDFLDTSLFMIWAGKERVENPLFH